MGSYTYDFEGDVLPGTQSGPLYEKQQVCVNNWYEAGSDNGIELMVAKNESFFYSLWWYVPAVSDVNYAAQVDDDALHAVKLSTKISSVSAAEAEEASLKNQCYFLTDVDYEDVCIAATSSIDDDDDDDDNTSSSSNSNKKKDDNDDDTFDSGDRDLLIAILTFVLLTFITAVAALLVLLLRKNAPPMANTAGGSSSNL